MSYPIAFHTFAGLFSIATLSRMQWLPNMVLHLLGCAFLSIVSWLITGGSLVAVAVVLATYLAMPSNWVFSGPAIAYLGLSERYLARLSSSASYLGLAAGTVLDQTWLLGLGAAAAALGVLSGQFARQSLFFCVPILSVVLVDARPVMFLVLGVAAAILVGRRHVWDGLRHTATQVEAVSNQDQAGRPRSAHDAWLLSLELARTRLVENRGFPIDGERSNTDSLLVSRIVSLRSYGVRRAI